MKSARLYFLLVLSLALSSLLIYTVFSQTSDLSREGPPGISALPPGDVTWDPAIAGMIATMNETNIYSTTDVLQRIPTRLYGTDGNVEAADHLYSELSGIPGLTVSYEDGSFKNIIGILPGTDTSSEEMVMVGAHYDSYSSDAVRAPGATDNACGVAIVLELARVMSQHQFNHTIAFALWNSEEQGYKGSNAYAESAAKSSLQIPLYFNYDSSCYDPEGHFVLDIMYNSQSSWAAEMMTQDNTLYGIDFTLTYNAHTCDADYKSFWSHGYPAVMTHEESHGPAHTPSDTIDQIASDYALKNGQLGMAVLAQVAEVRVSGAANVACSSVSAINAMDQRWLVSTLQNAGTSNAWAAPYSNLYDANQVKVDRVTAAYYANGGTAGSAVSYANLGWGAVPANGGFCEYYAPVPDSIRWASSGGYVYDLSNPGFSALPSRIDEV